MILWFQNGNSIHEVLDLLPTTMCITPEEALGCYTKALPNDGKVLLYSDGNTKTSLESLNEPKYAYLVSSASKHGICAYEWNPYYRIHRI